MTDSSTTILKSALLLLPVNQIVKAKRNQNTRKGSWLFISPPVNAHITGRVSMSITEKIPVLKDGRARAKRKMINRGTSRNRRAERNPPTLNQLNSRTLYDSKLILDVETSCEKR